MKRGLEGEQGMANLGEVTNRGKRAGRAYSESRKRLMREYDHKSGLNVSLGGGHEYGVGNVVR